ncbi:fungal specific transcription factor domain-containing [Fusarium albosuccineum]|uniref:Fungal specific transcription factor domain-containing n=1 Tax=Fusarium albosuccineum TaxID=1237068 RepID=A0A8H4PCB1_9HYPO|nr:fungal specific transcription factor domain-containing [Fusarium albosuccineum]
MESGAAQECSSLPNGAGHEANVPESAKSIPNQTQQGPRPSLEAGSLNTSASASSYVSGAHWVAILDSISELKEQVQSEDEDISKDHEDPLIRAEDHKPSLLFGYRCNLSKEDLIATLPARPMVDRWVSEYFNDLDMMPHVSCLHTGTFSREASRFGSTSSPTESGDSWGGATSSSGPLYLEQIVQCLVLGDYSQGGPYVIETLLHYFMIEHLRRPDTEVNTWLLLGVILRLGLRMGYHRDPSQFPNLAPFQREMRRRVWATLYVADVWQSIQIGAPRMFQDGQWDTRDPLNLVDTDFDETSSELPPSRDNGEVTHISFAIARFKLAKVMGAISDIINAIEPDPFKAAKAEKMLQETYDSLHPILKFTPGRSTLNEHPRTVLHQFLLAVSLHQAQVLLYQRYLTMPPDGIDSNGPLNVLINAALKILEYQNLMDLEIQPGESLWTVSSVKGPILYIGTSSIDSARD